MNRRLIVVSSMGGFDKSLNAFCDNSDRHGVGSWSLDEYLMAIKNTDFWKSVKHAFQNSDIRLLKPETLVESKYYHAGTSARFMFGSSIEEIEDTISTVIGAMSPRTKDCTSASSVWSKSFTHTLISFTYERGCVVKKTGFVSHYAARAFGVVSKAETIRALSKQCNFEANPKAEGWVFEAFFLASAAERPDIIVRTASRDPIVWNCPKPETCRVVVFRPKTLQHMVPLDTWLQPDSPQQPGFDAVMLLSNGLIRFIQTTVAREHDLKMWAFADLVTKLQQLGHEVTDAEVFFVIPDDAFANDFRITNVHGWKKFAALFPSWSKELEYVNTKVHTVMIRF